MIYTFHIKYNGIDDFGNIEFCAETKNDAIVLFAEWCIMDNKMQEPGYIESIEVVYNEEDAKEYGKKYGLRNHAS